MKILILHNLYQQRGGEDVAVEAEAALLRAGGHDVTLETVTNDTIASLADKARVFLRAPYDLRRKKWVQDLIARDRPDIVHIHNFFPLLTPAAHEASAESGIAVVQTLHNYRLTCAAAILMREGKVCEKCVGHSKAWGVVHRCYRGSIAGSWAVFRMQTRASSHGTWLRHVHRFIALSEFARRKFVEAGLPAEKIAIKPNFALPLDDSPSPRGRRGAVFVGRLSAEKGLDVLIRAWRHLPDIPLLVIGDGPERTAWEPQAPTAVTFAGAQPKDRVIAAMQSAACLILPSLSYEGFPLAVAEAFAAGTPVIASRLGSLPEIVRHRANGLLFTPGDVDELARTVAGFFSDPQLMSRLGIEALADYRARYAPETNLAQLEAIYRDAISASRRPPKRAKKA